MIISTLLLSILTFASALQESKSATDKEPSNHVGLRGVLQGQKIAASESFSPKVNSPPKRDASFQSGYNAKAAPEPPKTVYVNVPPQNYPPPPPIAAGPPRKHYRIVFIRSPAAPPQQQILPPRMEQKTLIYVLHPRRQQNEQNLIEVPNVQHDPQVYFVQYDKEPPTAQDLQQLIQNTIEGGTNPNFNFGSSASGSTGFAGSPGPANVYPPGSPGPGPQNGLQLRRGVSQQPFAEAPLRQELRQDIESQASEKDPVVLNREISKPDQERESQDSDLIGAIRLPLAPIKGANRRSDTRPIRRYNKEVRQSYRRHETDPSPELKEAFDDNRPYRFGSKIRSRIKSIEKGKVPEAR